MAIEAHFIDAEFDSERAKQFSAGKKITLELVRWIRSDRQFTDTNDLKKAIEADINNCKHALKLR